MKKPVKKQLFLSPDRIEELASQPGVKRIAVENFLGSLGDMTKQEAYANRDQDARSYGWNEATRGAITTGIVEAK